MTAIFSSFSVLLYCSFGYLYFFNAGLSPIKPLYWHLITIAVSISFVLASGRFTITQRSAVLLAYWAAAFAALCCLAFLWSSQSEVATQVLVTNTEALCLLIAFLYLFRKRDSQQLAAIAMGLAVLLGVVTIYGEFFYPTVWQFTTVPGRAAGLYENPNIAGNCLVLGMVLSAWNMPKHLRWWFCILVGTVVLLTFSRSSMILWGIAMIALAWHDRFAWRRWRSLAAIGGLLVLAGSAIVLGRMTGVLEIIGIGDLLTDNTFNRVTGSFFSQTDESAQGRRLVAQEGLRLFLNAPMTGQGLGATREWQYAGSTHNMYILMGAEMGIFGVALFLALIGILWSARTPLAQTVAVLFAVGSAFSHNQLDQPAMMIVLALVVSIPHDRAIRSSADGRTASRSATTIPVATLLRPSRSRTKGVET